MPLKRLPKLFFNEGCIQYYWRMNNGFNKIDWSRLGYALVFFGVPVMLIGSTFESSSATTDTLKWLPLLSGGLILLFKDREQLNKLFFPFSEKSGRGTARYLGLLGLLAFTAGRVLPPEVAKGALLLNTGLLLVAASAIWYLIRLVRFGEKGL